MKPIQWAKEERPEKLIVLDVETSGLPETDKSGNKDFSGVRVLEIGAIFAVDFGAKIESSFSSLIAWRDERDNRVPVPPEITELTGIDDAEIAEHGESPERAAARFADWLYPVLGHVKPSGVPVVGHNLVLFDWPCLHRFAETAALGGDQLLLAVFGDDRDAIRIDTRLAWQAYIYSQRRGPGERLETFYGRVARPHETHPAKSNLAFLAKLFVDTSGVPAHRALSDCLQTLAVYRALDVRGVLAETLGWK